MSKECGSIRISVVIPAYNAERYIQRAIESVLNQTYSPFEVIVIDDGSCDKTRSIVEQFGETVTCIHQENVGECQARNNGIQAANGDYIAFLDADDEWTSHHLENAAKVLGRFPELGWYSCAWERKAGPSKIGRVLRFRGKLKEGAAIEDYFSAAALSKGTIANSDTVVISKELLLSLGGFMEGMRRGGDRLMWFRLGLIEPRLGYSPSVGAIYYSIEGSATSRDDDKDPGAFISHVISAMRENTAIPISHSCISFLNQLVYKEIQYCLKRKDLNSLLIIKNECKELISRKNLLLIRMGLLFPNIMKVKTKLTKLLRRQKKRIIGIFIRIRILLHGSVD